MGYPWNQEIEPTWDRPPVAGGSCLHRRPAAGAVCRAAWQSRLSGAAGDAQTWRSDLVSEAFLMVSMVSVYLDLDELFLGVFFGGFQKKKGNSVTPKITMVGGFVGYTGGYPSTVQKKLSKR